jgi:head-tail adaptor
MSQGAELLLKPTTFTKVRNFQWCSAEQTGERCGSEVNQWRAGATVTVEGNPHSSKKIMASEAEHLFIVEGLLPSWDVTASR